MKHEHSIGQINKHREGTVEVWDSECVHANLAGVLVKEEAVMQSHFLMLEFSLNMKVGVDVFVHHSVPLCAGLKMPGCTDMSVCLLLCACVCVCFWEYVYFLSSMQQAP